MVEEENDKWFRQAEEDLSSAKYNFDGGKYYVVAFLCQQAIEKGLKALWLKEGNELVRTHDLVKLAGDVGLDEKFYSDLDDLSVLYNKSRYSLIDDEGIPADMSGEDVESFIKLVEDVLEWVKKKI